MTLTTQLPEPVTMNRQTALMVLCKLGLLRTKSSSCRHHERNARTATTVVRQCAKQLGTAPRLDQACHVINQLPSYASVIRRASQTSRKKPAVVGLRPATSTVAIMAVYSENGATMNSHTISCSTHRTAPMYPLFFLQLVKRIRTPGRGCEYYLRRVTKEWSPRRPEVDMVCCDPSRLAFRRVEAVHATCLRLNADVCV